MVHCEIGAISCRILLRGDMEGNRKLDSQTEHRQAQEHSPGHSTQVLPEVRSPSGNHRHVTHLMYWKHCRKCIFGTVLIAGSLQRYNHAGDPVELFWRSL